MFNQNLELIVNLVPPSLSGALAEHRYSKQTLLGDLTFWTLSFDEGDADKFAQFFNFEMICPQSVITVSLPNGKEYYLTGGIRERPFVGSRFGDLIVIQIRESVYCLSISADLAVKHTFTLSKPLGWYESAILYGDCLTVHYVPKDKITDNKGVDIIPTCETFYLA